VSEVAAALPAPLPGRKDDAGRAAADDAGVFVFARVAAEAVQLLAFAIAAWYLTRESFAYLSFSLMVTVSAVTLGSLGLAESVFYFIGQRPGQGPAIVRQTTFLLGLAAVPVIAIVGSILFVGRPVVDLRASFPWIVAVLCLELPTQPAINLLVASKHARLASGVYIFFAALRGLAILSPVLFGVSVTWVLPGLAAASLLRLVTYSLIVHRFFPGPVTWFDKGALRAMFSFTLPVGLAELCGGLNAQIDKYVVSLILTVQDVADYSVGSWEVPLITTIPYAIGTVLQPRYVKLHVERRHDELVDLWHSAVRKTSLIVIPAALMLMALAEEIIAAVFSPKFSRAALPFRLFTGILLLRFAAYGAIFRATGHTKPLLKQAGILVGANLILTVPFTKLFGFPGPAMATLTANWIVWFVTLATMSRILSVPFRRVLPWRAYITTVVAGTVISVAVWVVKRFAGLPPGPTLALCIPLYLVLFTVLGRTIGIITAEDMGFLRRWLSLRMLRKG
jgi:O-antigen/teichoic acid export membrane protein